MPANILSGSNTTVIKLPCLKDSTSKERSKKHFAGKSGFPAVATSILIAPKRCIRSTSTQVEAMPAKADVEESLVRINLEAAEEIARQLRLRNIGGLIICDFIDMRLRKNQRRLLDRLKDCMKEDSAKCTILGMSEFGLVEMTRQRNRGSLMQTIFTLCPYCNGSGMVKSHESISIEIERALKKILNGREQFALKLMTHPQLDQYLNSIDKSFLMKFAAEQNAQLQFDSDDNLHLNDWFFCSMMTNKRIEV